MAREGQLRFIIKMRDEATAQLKRVNASLRETSRDAKGVAGATTAAAAGTTRAGVAANGATAGFGNLSKSMATTRAVATGLNSAFLMLGASVSLIAGVSIMADFGDKISTVRAVTQATDDQFKTLRNTAISLGETTRFTAGQAAEGLEFLSRAGFSVQQSLDSANATLALAASGQLELGEAADLVTNVMSSYGLAATRAGEAADILAFTAGSSNTNVAELGVAIRYAGSAASAFGVDLQETNLALGALADRGLKGSLAGTGLRRVLTKLNAPSKGLAELLKKAGLSMDDVSTKARGLIPVLRTLKEAGAEEFTSEIFKAFGDRGGPTFLVLLKNLEKVDFLLNKQKQSTKQAAAALDYYVSTGERLGNRGRLTETLRGLSVNNEQTAGRVERAGGDASKLDQSRGLLSTVEALKDADAKTIIAEFGETTGRVLIKLRNDFEKSSAAIGAYEDDLTGFNERMAIMMDNNLGGALRRLLAGFQSLFIRLDQDQDGPLRRMIEGMALLFRYMAGGEDALEGIRASAEALGYDVEKTEKVLHATAKAIQFVATAAATLYTILTTNTAILAFAKALRFISGPLGFIVVTLATMTAALVVNRDEMLKNSQGLTTWGDQTQAVFEYLRDFVIDVIDTFDLMFELLDDWLKISQIDFGGWAMGLINFLKDVTNGFIGLATSLPDIFATSFSALGRLFTDFGTEATKELMKPLTALQAAGSGDLAGAVAIMMTGGGDFKKVIDGQFEEFSQLMTRVNERVKTDYVGGAIQAITDAIGREISEIDRRAVEITKGRAEEYAQTAELAALAAYDAVKDITAFGQRQLAAGDKSGFEQTQELIAEAQAQASAAAEFYAQTVDAAGAGNVKLAGQMAKKAERAAQKAEATLAGRDMPTPADPDPDVTENDGIVPPTAEEIAAEQAREQFKKQLAQTVAGINARTKALSSDAETQRRWNALAALGIDLSQKTVRTKEEAAAIEQVDAALRKETVAIGEAQIRTLGLETDHVRAQIAQIGLTGRARAEEAAILEERMRIAKENSLTTLAEAVISQEAETAIRALAAAQYDLSNSTMTATQGAAQGWEDWKKKVSDVGSSMKNVIGSALNSLSSTMTSFLMGQEVSWANFATSVISMIGEIIVQMLIMKAIQASMNFLGIPTPAAQGGVPGVAAHTGPVGQFAKGGSFANSLVNSPTFFKFAKGGAQRMGVMGEAGPEAVMPLKRMASGNLGVEVAGGGGAVFAPNVTINYTAGGSGSREDAKMISEMVDKMLEAKMADFAQRQRRATRPGMVGG